MKSKTISLIVLMMLIANIMTSNAIAQVKERETADSLNAQGHKFFNKGDYHAALAKYQKALQILLLFGNKKSICSTLISLADTEIQVGQYDSSETHAERILEIATSIAEQQFIADGYRILGDINYIKGEYNKAKESYFNARKIFEAIGDSSGLSTIYHNMGNIYAEQGNLELSTDFYRQTLKLDRVLGEIPGVGKSLYNIGLNLLLIGDFSTALFTFDSAKTIFAEIGDTTHLGMIFGSIGTTYNALGDYSKALNYLERGLYLSEQARDSFSIAVVNGNMADVYLNQCNYTRAIQLNLKAGSFFKKIGNDYNFSIFLLNTGAIYTHLGHFDKAFEYYQQSLKAKENINDQYGVGILYGDIGDLYLARDSLNKAQIYFEKALEIAKEIDDKPTTGRALTNLSQIFSHLGECEKAEHIILEAIHIFKTMGTKSTEAEAIIQLGDLKIKQRDYVTAKELYQDALLIGEQIEKPDIIWKAYAGIGSVYESKNQLDSSIVHYQSALKMLEKIRVEISSSEQRASFLAASLSPFVSLIRVLDKLHNANPSKGFERQAFAVVERFKARSFVELLVESKVNIRKGLSDEQQIHEKEILRRISYLQFNLLNRTTTDNEKKEILEKINHEEENLDRLQAEIRQSNPIYAALKYPIPVHLDSIQKNFLREGELLVEFCLDKDQSYLWLISKDHARMIQLLGENHIDNLVRPFIEELRKRPSSATVNSSIENLNKLGSVIYDMIFGQANEELKNAKRLIVVPDGILFYLPFEALPLPDDFYVKKSKRIHINKDTFLHEYLVNHLPITYVPSATVLAQLKQQKSKHQDLNDSTHLLHKSDSIRLALCAFGDPVFPDHSQPVPDTQFVSMHSREILMRNLEELCGEIKPLPSTREEILQIASLFPSEGVHLYLGDNATETQVKNENLTLFTYAHFATHGYLDEKIPGRSGLILSIGVDSLEDGILQMNEIFNISLAADVVVLSACETGLGKLIRGEGLVGLTRAFHYAGAQSLVVSLWKVADVSTAKLMKEFYIQLLKGQSPAIALRRAKQKMISSSVMLYRHPFHWSGFIIHGTGK